MQTSVPLPKSSRFSPAHGEQERPIAGEPSKVLEPDFGPYAKAILERRKADARRLQGFAVRLQGADNLAFMLEVLDEMVFGSSLAQLTYSVSLSTLAPRERDLWAKRSKRYFENEQAAAAFAHLRLRDLMKGKGMGGTQLKIEFDERVVFWCVHAMEAGLQVLHNEMNLPLPELDG